MFIVVAYDVVEDRRRNKVFKALKNHGRHVQYSVFECELRLNDLRRLQTQLTRLINPGEDNVRFYFLDRDAVSRIESLGKSRLVDLSGKQPFLIM
ncbi:MAG: CRISPR-associated endonuclease Cas2 [Chloroflexi bacterium]|nr:CRISPR-associated endonuclease Cas2 [Chloroflexota bacterium]